MPQSLLQMSAVTQGWAAFDRLDMDDESSVTGFRILLHVPNRICIARWDFPCGIGYELTYTTLQNPDDTMGLYGVLPLGTRLLTIEDFGWSEAGYAQTRIRAWTTLN